MSGAFLSEAGGLGLVGSMTGVGRWAARTRAISARGLVGGFGAGGVGGFDFVYFGVGFDIRRGGIVGDFFDHGAGVEAELDAAGVADGGVEGAEDELGALGFDGAAEQGVDDFHEGGRMDSSSSRRAA